VRRHVHSGGCHCGAIEVELTTDRAPEDQVIGACQCGFCRKHNARTFSDPKAVVVLTARRPELVQRYVFGLGTAAAIVCGRCGVYVAMLLTEGAEAWSTINVDALADRARFTREAAPRDYGSEDTTGRIARRRTRWIPTTLAGFPALPVRD
jgi:hypothetical protein